MNERGKFNPELHHRKSIRLQDYDYSQPGLYFITICVQKKECLFGKIINDKLIINDAGKMTARWYFEIEKKFKDIKCREYIIMPNHFHCVVQKVGADLCVCPNDKTLFDNKTISGEHIGSPLQENDINISGEHTGSPLQKIVQWFKTMTTNEYIRNVKENNWKRFDGKLWQRNYFEHIIRTEKAYLKIIEYIFNNPLTWLEDSINPDFRK